jgi:xanthine dehydrogenase accessory factor
MSVPGGIWIQGAGEMASAVAVTLLEAGYGVLMAEIERPLAVRRLVCFSDAVYAGAADVAGWRAVRTAADGAVYGRAPVPVIVDPQAERLRTLGALAVVDARMTKRPPERLPRGAAPLIGLGPGFTAGTDCDAVIETHRTAGPGTVITRGAALPNTGEPGEVGGETARRLLRTPAGGRLIPLRSIGDLVAAGEVVATVSGLPVTSALDGMLRGLVHPDAELSAGEKVGDVEPRGLAVDPAALTDKGRAVGAGVLAALRGLGAAPAD